MSGGSKGGNVCMYTFRSCRHGLASSPMWRVCMQDNNVCVAREGVSSGRGINHRFQFCWALICCILLVCSDGPMPMHAPSEPFLGSGVEAAGLHVPLFRIFSPAAPIRLEGKMEEEIEQQVGIIMGLFWDGAKLMQIEKRRTREKKQKMVEKVVISKLVGVGKLEITKLARFFWQVSRVQYLTYPKNRTRVVFVVLQ